MRLVTSTNGVKRIAGFEGTILHLYFDVAGIQTVCTGHVTLPGEDWSAVTREKCEATLGRDLSRFETCVNDNIKVTINQTMFDALVSLAFNIGCGDKLRGLGFAGSSVVRLLNQGLYSEAASAFLLWRYAQVKQKDGTFRKQPILLGRREAEALLFRKGFSQLIGGNASEPSIEELLALSQERLFDLRALLDDRGLPAIDTNEYADDGRIVVLPPEQEELAA